LLILDTKNFKKQKTWKSNKLTKFPKQLFSNFKNQGHNKEGIFLFPQEFQVYSFGSILQSYMGRHIGSATCDINSSSISYINYLKVKSMPKGNYMHILQCKCKLWMMRGCKMRYMLI